MVIRNYAIIGEMRPVVKWSEFSCYLSCVAVTLDLRNFSLYFKLHKCSECFFFFNILNKVL